MTSMRYHTETHGEIARERAEKLDVCSAFVHTDKSGRRVACNEHGSPNPPVGGRL